MRRGLFESRNLERCQNQDQLGLSKSVAGSYDGFVNVGVSVCLHKFVWIMKYWNSAARQTF